MDSDQNPTYSCFSANPSQMSADATEFQPGRIPAFFPYNAQQQPCRPQPESLPDHGSRVPHPTGCSNYGTYAGAPPTAHPPQTDPSHTLSHPHYHCGGYYQQQQPSLGAHQAGHEHNAQPYDTHSARFSQHAPAGSQGHAVPHQQLAAGRHQPTSTNPDGIEQNWRFSTSVQKPTPVIDSSVPPAVSEVQNTVKAVDLAEATDDSNWEGSLSDNDQVSAPPASGSAVQGTSNMTPQQASGPAEAEAPYQPEDNVNRLENEAIPATDEHPQKLQGDIEVELVAKPVVAAKLKDPDPRPHLNVVFIGHVDAGKSTTCGNILVLTGRVDQRTLEKYERDAKEKNRETWFYAFIVDINEEERQKGKTVEVGRATFQLEKTRFTILDAPGHRGFIPNMIGGAAQADTAVLIISARKGEFETGFERGGQTREHAMLAKTLGVSRLIVAVNKMDDPTCNWKESRFREIEKRLTPFLRGCGYNPARDITFIPISGLSGQNLKYHATDPRFPTASLASWYGKSEPTLFEILDNITPPERNEKDALRIPLLEGFRDQGPSAVGKVESGTIVAGQTVMLMPKKLKAKVLAVNIDDEDVAFAKPGENVVLRLVGVEEDQISKGSVLCAVDNLCPVVTNFKAQIMIVELLDHRPLLTIGYSCVFHAHTAAEECQITKLWEVIDKATKKKKLNPSFVKNNTIVVCNIQVTQSLCLEPFDVRPQLGRFTLRDEGKTIAIGKVLEIIN